jgi:DNA excision repair protein ERCC-4
MLRTLPGVNEGIIKTVMMRVENIEELANMLEREVCWLVGTDAGRRIYRFFNRSVYDDVALPTFS